jgi:hypothetical protein
VLVRCPKRRTGTESCTAAVVAEAATGARLGRGSAALRPGTSRIVRVLLTRRVGLLVLQTTRTANLASGKPQVDVRTLRVRAQARSAALG